MDEPWIRSVLEDGMPEGELAPGFEAELRTLLADSWHHGDVGRSSWARRRRPWLLVAACLALIGVGGVGIVVVRNGVGPGPAGPVRTSAITVAVPVTPAPTSSSPLATVPDPSSTAGTMAAAAPPWTVTLDAVGALLPILEPVDPSDSAPIEIDLGEGGRAAVTIVPAPDGDAKSTSVCVELVSLDGGVGRGCGQRRDLNGLLSGSVGDNAGRVFDLYATATDVTIDSPDCAISTTTGPAIRLTVCARPSPDSIHVTASTPDGHRYTWVEPIMSNSPVHDPAPAGTVRCDADTVFPPARTGSDTDASAHPTVDASVDTAGRITVTFADDAGRIANHCVDSFSWREPSTTGYAVAVPYAGGYLVGALTTQPLDPTVMPPWPLVPSTSTGAEVTAWFVTDHDNVSAPISPLHAELSGKIAQARRSTLTPPPVITGPIPDLR